MEIIMLKFNKFKYLDDIASDTKTSLLESRKIIDNNIQQCFRNPIFHKLTRCITKNKIYVKEI